VRPRSRHFLLGLLTLAALACGRPAQSEDCKKLISCANALRAGSGDGAYGPTYGPDGPCWLTDDAASACTQTCQSLVENMARRPNAPAECR
jgi:hypothetical protein